MVVSASRVPAAVIAAVDDRDDDPAAGVTNLTAAEKHGRELFAERCSQVPHAQGGQRGRAGRARTSTTLRPPKGLVLDAIKNGRARGNGQMAAEPRTTGEDAEDVAAFVAKAVGQTGQPPARRWVGG